MARTGIAGLFNVNRSVTNLGDESRQFRLPTVNPFPKLDQRVVRQNAGVAQSVKVRGAVVLDRQSGLLPEMASDIVGVDAGYALENVRRDRVEARPWSRVGFAHLVGRMLGGSQPMARP